MGSTTIITILLSTVLPLGITLFLVIGVFGRIQKEQQQNEQLLATGIPGQARVLALQHTGQRVAVMGHRHLRLGVTLEIYLQGRPPYHATITPLISELYVAMVYPGATVSVRVDPTNPMNVALALGSVAAAPAAAAPGGYAPAGYAGPGSPSAMHPGVMQPGAMQHGAAYPGMQASMSPGLSANSFGRAKKWIIVMSLVTTIPTAAILLGVFVDWSAILGDSDAPKGGYCKAAAKCCRAVSKGGGAAALKACDNLEDLPGVGCKDAYEQFKESAEAMDKTCK